MTNSDPQGESFEALLPRAKAGHASAQFAVGVRLATGNGEPKDELRAVIWSTKAALREYGYALYNLRQAVSQGLEGARQHLEAVGQYGDAKLTLARAFWYGDGIRQASFRSQALGHSVMKKAGDFLRVQIKRGQ